ncbi:MAG: DNA-deoxyinosine glycosylase [Spirochaetia bacterium]|jgi:TDG/mug DNA glycosylase family protein
MKGMPPIGSAQSRVLILGSFPSAISLEKGQYYGNGNNHFWDIMGLLLGEPFPEEYQARLALLVRYRIAVWDVLASCERPGSLDKDISNERPNSLIDYIIENPSIERVALNGLRASLSFIRHFAPGQKRKDLGIGSEIEWRPETLRGRGVLVARLPSSSPIPTREYRTAGEKVMTWKAFLLPPAS